MKRGRPSNGTPPGTDIVLRGGGAILLAIAAGAIRWLLLRAHMDPAAHPNVLTYGLAAIAFLGASLGGGLLCLGAHIHDRIAISPLWSSRAAQDHDGGPAPGSRRETVDQPERSDPAKPVSLLGRLARVRETHPGP